MIAGGDPHGKRYMVRVPAQLLPKSNCTVDDRTPPPRGRPWPASDRRLECSSVDDNWWDRCT